ncbi:MAG: HU family DNA-binding protein [Gammaproteobacteria bacterium]|nr:HU family DNA-binding protein [Gammaproteobacteria bacterium]
MTTTEVIKLLSIRLQISQAEARRCLLQELEIISTHMNAESQVVLRRFGTFGVKQTAARKTYLPSEKKYYITPARTVPFFRAAQGLKDFVKSWKPE